jgi:biopolymer transport protein ExbB/TolQ
MDYTELGMAAAIISLLLSHVLLERRVRMLQANVNHLAEKVLVTVKVVARMSDIVAELHERLKDDGK